jgi:hypothetical protein
MSLGILIKAPEGLVLAAESRVTLTTQIGPGIPLHVNFDNATKLFSFHKPFDKIGVVTYGQAAIGLRTAQSFIPEFESTLTDVEKIFDFAKKLSAFFLDQWNKVVPTGYIGQDMTFNVAGFDDNEPYGKVYSFSIPRFPEPIEQSPMVNGQYQFGITYGGQKEIVDRLILGYDSRIFQILATVFKIDKTAQELQQIFGSLSLPLPIQLMPLQDCVDIALLFLRTTIDAQKLTVGVRGCGGAIDLAIITRNNPLQFIQKKSITGEKM